MLTLLLWPPLAWATPLPEETPAPATEFAAALVSAPVSPHPVVTRLVEAGWPVADGTDAVKLTPPLLRPGMTGEEQREAMRQSFGERRLARVLDDSVVAPQVFRPGTEQAGVDADGKPRLVRRLDQYFVLHGDLAVLRDRGLLDNFVGGERAERKNAKGGDDGFAEYMELRDPPPEGEEADPAEPYLARYRLPLIDKVIISGLVRGQSVSRPGLIIESVVSTADVLGDAADPTIWQAIPRRAKRDADLGPPTPYRGLAAYLQVTQLRFQPGALLVECHAVLEEPYGWFNGRNLLASKLATASNENVRSLRRKLAKAMEEAAAENGANREP